MHSIPQGAGNARTKIARENGPRPGDVGTSPLSEFRREAGETVQPPLLVWTTALLPMPVLGWVRW
jgi:hypothetical protein